MTTIFPTPLPAEIFKKLGFTTIKPHRVPSFFSKLQRQNRSALLFNGSKFANFRVNQINFFFVPPPILIIGGTPRRFRVTTIFHLLLTMPLANLAMQYMQQGKIFRRDGHFQICGGSAARDRCIVLARLISNDFVDKVCRHMTLSPNPPEPPIASSEGTP